MGALILWSRRADSITNRVNLNQIDMTVPNKDAISLWDRIKNLDKTFSWSFWGLVLAGVLGAFSIWAYFNDPSPKLTYEILTNTAVLDIREEVDKLQLLYDGNDITDSDRSLQVVTLRVVNDGPVDITKTLYDAENAPLGLKLSAGEIVDKPTILSFSRSYIKENLQPKITSVNQVTFQPIVLNSKDYFTVKILALVPSEDISVTPIGIVAGINEIDVVETYKDGATSDHPWSTWEVYEKGLYVVAFLSIWTTLLYFWLSHKFEIRRSEREYLLQEFAARRKVTPFEGLPSEDQMRKIFYSVRDAKNEEE